MIHEEVDMFPGWFLTLESVTIIFLFLFVLVSFLVYFLEMQIVFAYRKTTFRGPFYRLMFVGIIVDMLSAINIFTGQIVPARKYFEQFLLANQSWLGTIFFFITYGGRCVQGATATILSFCRVTAVCFPMLYRKLNQPSYIYCLQFLQIAGVFVAGYLLIPQQYEYILENDGYYSVDSNDDDAIWFYNFVAALELFFVLAIVVNNVVTYAIFHVKFGKKPKSTQPTTQNKPTNPQIKANLEKQKRESSLDRMTFIVCCVELIYFAFVVYSLQINQSMNKRVFYYLYNILCVFYSTFSAWMLLIVSKPITVQFQQRFSRLRGLRSSRSFSISAQGSQGNNK